MKLLLAMLVSLVLVSGCSAEAKTTVCNLEQTGIKETLTIVSEGDQVKSQSSELTYGEELATPEDFALVADQMEAMLAGYDGVSVEVTGDLSLSLSINYDEADFDELYSVGLITEAGVDYIDYDTSIEGLEAQGYICE